MILVERVLADRGRVLLPILANLSMYIS